MVLDKNILFNIPNMLSLVRLVIIIVMCGHIRKRPIMTFFLCLASGLVDMIDGRIARYLDQASQFGALTDVFIDRLTSQAQFFALASFFPRYSMIFMTASTLEMSSDLFRCRRWLFLSELKITLPKVGLFRLLH